MHSSLQASHRFEARLVDHNLTTNIGVVLLFSSLFVGRLSDLQYRRYKTRHNGKPPPPERRLDVQMFAYGVAIAGKLMFGWFTERKYHPAAGLAASGLSKSHPGPFKIDRKVRRLMTFPAAAGTGIIMVSSTSYQTEFQPTAMASLVALGGLLRNAAAAISAAIIDSLLNRMGYGWLFTGLAIMDALCIVGLFYIRLRGHVYREKLLASSAVIRK